MDFFEQQDAARKRTRLLVGLFLAAVIAIIIVVYIVVHVALGPPDRPVDGLLLLLVSAAVVLVISTGSAVRIASLRRGGPAVAELLGARRISMDTTDHQERRLVNVIEEMSIASGTPVPAIYVMDRQDGINAFAAGYSTHDAAVAVTRGALRDLSRDELQGVIAHEFSHILNGDMRLNIRLIGILYGILLLAVIGRGVLYAGPRGRRGRNGGGGWVLLVGIALLIVGYIGVFFGKLIKAAVSRQREYLADSAAVQFTRNPVGLAGALKKIGGQAHGSRIEDHHAEELSHLFFANGLKSNLSGFLSTHPPLEERIRRLDSSWDGTYPAVTPAQHALAGGSYEEEGPVQALSGRANAGELIGSVGTPAAGHLAYASKLLHDLPDDLRTATHQTDDAVALLFALIASGNPTFGRAERDVIRSFGGEPLHERVAEMLRLIDGMGPEARLPLMDLALPAIQTMSPDKAQQFRESLGDLVRADGQIRMFEYALVHAVRRHVDVGDAAHPVTRTIKRFDLVGNEMRIVLSAVAWAGSEGEGSNAAAGYDAGRQALDGHIELLPLIDSPSINLTRIDDALSTLERAAPKIRAAFLNACAETAGHDGVLQRPEAELLRAISEALDCPMPPVITES